MCVCLSLYLFVLLLLSWLTWLLPRRKRRRRRRRRRRRPAPEYLSPTDWLNILSLGCVVSRSLARVLLGLTLFFLASYQSVSQSVSRDSFPPNTATTLTASATVSCCHCYLFYAEKHLLERHVANVRDTHSHTHTHNSTEKRPRKRINPPWLELV